jgi:hypothetical protein
MTIQMFRYAACGGGNFLLNVFLYFVSYNFILEKQVLDLDFIAFKPHIAAFLHGIYHHIPYWFLPQYVCGISRFLPT